MKNSIYLFFLAISFIFMNCAFTQEENGKFTYFSDTNSYLSTCDTILKDTIKKANDCRTDSGKNEEYKQGLQKCLSIKPYGNIDEMAIYKYRTLLKKANHYWESAPTTGDNFLCIALGAAAAAGDILGGGCGGYTAATWAIVSAWDQALEKIEEEKEQARKEWNLYQIEKGYNKTIWSE